jgi:hypothetical protein
MVRRPAIRVTRATDSGFLKSVGRTPLDQVITIWRACRTTSTEAFLTVKQDKPDPEFNATTNRLLRREALRRAAEELNTTSGPGLENMLARISAEATAEAVERHANQRGVPELSTHRPHPSAL